MIQLTYAQQLNSNLLSCISIAGTDTFAYFSDGRSMHTGAEVALSNSTDGYKYFTLRGNGSCGRVDVESRTVIYEDPETNDQYEVKVRVDNRRYYVHDSRGDKHLGSNRVTIDSTGTVLNAQDYYAFGELLRSYNLSTPNDRYKFMPKALRLGSAGKERDTETDLDYFGARYYDSEIGRWLNVDPLADKYPGWSPYNYVMNNPLNAIDPNGMEMQFLEDMKRLDQQMSAFLGTNSLTPSGSIPVVKSKAQSQEDQSTSDPKTENIPVMKHVRSYQESFFLGKAPSCDETNGILADVIDCATSWVTVFGDVYLKGDELYITVSAKSSLSESGKLGCSNEGTLIDKTNGVKLSGTQKFKRYEGQPILCSTEYMGSSKFKMPSFGPVSININIRFNYNQQSSIALFFPSKSFTIGIR